MPLAFVGMALVTHYLVGLDWTTSFLVGAVLAPTDPVFASAIVGRKEVPAKLRQLLNVESGINDGLALPVVLVLIAAAGPTAGQRRGVARRRSRWSWCLGLALGIVLPLLVNGLVRFRLLGAEPKLQPLLPLAIGIILYAACHLTHANPYLAAFSAGAVLAARLAGGEGGLRAARRGAGGAGQVRRAAGLRRAADPAAVRRPVRRRVRGGGPGDRADPPGLAADLAARHAIRPPGEAGRGLVRAEGLRVGGVRPAGAAVRHPAGPRRRTR